MGRRDFVKFALNMRFGRIFHIAQCPMSRTAAKHIQCESLRWVIMGAIASEIISLTTVYSTVYSGVDQRKHQSSASLALGPFPAQMASNADNVSIWWRHHSFPEKKCIRLREICIIQCSVFCDLARSPRTFKVNLPLKNLRPRQNGRVFVNDFFKNFSLNNCFYLLIKIPMIFVTKGPINNIGTSIHIMVWRRSGDKPLSEPMMA